MFVSSLAVIRGKAIGTMYSLLLSAQCYQSHCSRLLHIVVYSGSEWCVGVVDLVCFSMLFNLLIQTIVFRCISTMGAHCGGALHCISTMATHCGGDEQHASLVDDSLAVWL